MLVLSAKHGDGIRMDLGEGRVVRVVVVRLVDWKGRAVGVRLGIEAPASVNVVREAVLNREGKPNGRSQ